MVRARDEARGIAEIAVNAPLDRLFHYRVPEALRDRLERGHRVLVPFGHRTTTGVCVGFPADTDIQDLKPLREILQPDCRFDAHLLDLTRWIATYYFASWGEVLEAALPPGLKSRKKPKAVERVEPRASAEALQAEATRLERRAPSQARVLAWLATGVGPQPSAELVRDLPTSRDALRKLAGRGLLALTETASDESLPAPDDTREAAGEALRAARLPDDAVELTPAQTSALDAIREALGVAASGSVPAPLLIHGVTGSGKTEVYLRALHEVLRSGRRGLVLVPEISLTPQTVAKFRHGLPDVPIAVLHSMLTAKERAMHWRDIQSGRVGVVIGARSAVFSPVRDLGIVIVDEEHEPSYKQESSPRYHGRDVAVMRAHLLAIPVVLGSATPSLESAYNARRGKYRLLEMPERVTRHDLPSVTVVPLGGEYYRADGKGLISGPLDFQIKQCLKRREQAILFLNRRGYSTYMHCIKCAHVLKCEFCDIALTYHRGAGETRCHYCDARYTAPGACPECRFPAMKRSGVGTEKVVDVLGELYRDARVLRMDRDVVRGHDALKEVLGRFGRGEADILVGTQMIAKGHDFPRVSLVGIVSADTGLHFPDFRSAERTFQLITQVSGRAGRGDSPGIVIVQTFFPDNFAIDHAVKGRYAEFMQLELENRRALGYPPFGRLARILVQDANGERAMRCATDIVERLRRAAAQAARSDGAVGVLGPAEAPVAKIQERHRVQILIKAPDAPTLQRVLRHATLQRKGRTSAEIIVDVDPHSML